MSKTDQVAQTISQLKAFQSDPRSDAAIEALTKAVTSKSNLVVAKAAEIIHNARLEQFVPQLTAAFDRFMPEGKSSDAGCFAKTAIAKTLYELEVKAEPLFLRGVHHIQMEGVWGGNADTAAELRGICALGLVRCNYRDVLNELAELLVDAEVSARLMAARAIAYSENDAGAPLLRMKLLAGDQSIDVIAECFSALLKLTPRKAIAFIATRFLDLRRDEDLVQAALLALGDSRQPVALDLLKERFHQELIGDKKTPYLLPIAMTRLPQSIDFLLEVIASEHRSVAVAAIEAMKIHHADENLRTRIKAEIEKRGEDELRRVFDLSFGAIRQ